MDFFASFRGCKFNMRIFWFYSFRNDFNCTSTELPNNIHIHKNINIIIEEEITRPETD